MLLAAIDTSASLGPADLARIAAELRSLLRLGLRVAVVHCDEEVRHHGWLRLTSGPMQFHGRGTTDLRPPFAQEMRALYRPDAIAYFTDGEGPAPDRAPHLPVLWVLTSVGTRPAPWGRAVKMGDD